MFLKSLFLKLTNKCGSSLHKILQLPSTSTYPHTGTSTSTSTSTMESLKEALPEGISASTASIPGYGMIAQLVLSFFGFDLGEIVSLYLLLFGGYQAGLYVWNRAWFYYKYVHSSFAEVQVSANCKLLSLGRALPLLSESTMMTIYIRNSSHGYQRSR
jgi:hypothetical protein